MKGNRKSWSRYLTFFIPHHDTPQGNAPKAEAEAPAATALKIDRKKPLILNEETIRHYIICEHCHPIPGDDVLGYFDGQNRITIHKRQCEIASKLKASDGNHILAATWDTHKELFFPVNIHLQGIDHVGVLHQMTAILSQQLNVNIKRLNIQTDGGIFRGDIQLEVHDVSDLQAICRDLKKIEEVEEVTRF